MMALPTGANASHWWHVMERGNYPGRSEDFVDQDSVRSNAEGSKLITTMMVTEQQFGRGLNAMQSLYEVDCPKGRSRSILRLGLKPDGTAVGQPDRQPLAWGDDQPGSLAAIVQNVACTGRLPDDAFDIGGLDPQVVSRAYFSGDASE